MRMTRFLFVMVLTAALSFSTVAEPLRCDLASSSGFRSECGSR